MDVSLTMSRDQRGVLAGQPVHACASLTRAVCCDVGSIYHCTMRRWTIYGPPGGKGTHKLVAMCCVFVSQATARSATVTTVPLLLQAKLLLVLLPLPLCSCSL